ncbi:hypothetical protein AB833_27405 [Chromatiales bacterium (ex Bugula neritina AB1)]|nr:hypothetical protein AB833_27405 [Chromatiales bacterium (ex Bugula neritina AB1)]
MNQHLPDAKPRGFTLIELLIVIAIVGIISAFAYPSYIDYVLRSARSEGAASLLEVMERQEQYYRNNLSYTTNLADLGYSQPVSSETQRYVVTASTCESVGIRRCVLLTATAQGTQLNDGDITLNSRGEKNDKWPGQ